MATIKPLLLVLLSVFLIGAFLNFAIAPFLDTTTPDNESVLYSVSDVIENGYDINISVPVFGDIETNFDIGNWLFLTIDSLQDFVVSQLNLLTYLPDGFALPIVVILILVLAFTVVTIIRGN